MSVKLHERTVTDELAIKHYGKFRRFMKDRRLWDDNRQGEPSGLLHYYAPDTPIPRLELKEALDTYELGREKLIEKVLNLEELIFEHFGEQLTGYCKEKAAIFEAQEDKKLQNKATSYRKNPLPHFIQLEFLEEEILKTQTTRLTRDQLAMLRNKFFHNQIPYSEWLQETLQSNAPKDIPTAMIQLVVGEYDALISATEKIK
jgi:hypothetical protein